MSRLKATRDEVLDQTMGLDLLFIPRLFREQLRFQPGNLERITARAAMLPVCTGF